MHRRSFLRLAAGALPTLLSVQTPGARRKVVVIGAGLAGLAAAYKLDRAGHDVVVLEAQGRPGGRVYTLRAPFSDGLYAEAGAARIQDTHAFTLQYVKHFGLTLDPFFPAVGARVTGFRRQRYRGLVDLTRLPLDFSEEERRLGYGRSVAKYLFAHLPALGDPASATWPAQDLSRFETSIADFCRRQGASAAMLQVIALGHDLTGMSALQFLRDAALGAGTKLWFKIRGGNDLLPRAFANALTDRMHYGAPVVRIEQTDTAVRVTHLRANTPETISADYVVCTLPTAVMRGVETRPPFSTRKRAAFDAVGSLPMARVLLQMRTRFWHQRDESGWGSSDDPIDVWDYTRDQPGQRGILGAYTSGRMAHAISAMAPNARGPFVLEMMERLHPGSRDHFEVSASHSWITDPWARGAGAAFDAGQLSAHYQALRTPEGRVHFGGEHTSPWSGWMNGALESGVRAAAEIAARR